MKDCKVSFYLLGCFLFIVAMFVTTAAYAQPPWESGSYYPSWGNIQPSVEINFSGGDLEAAINNLQPGEKLIIAPGTYSASGRFSISVQGTPEAPIWIAASDLDNKPVITRLDNNHNVIDVDLAQYVVFHGLEITGPNHLLRLYDVSNIWVDQCYLHDAGDVGIMASSHDTNNLYITRNEIRGTGVDSGAYSGTGDGMFLGASYGDYIMTDSIIALNKIHQTNSSRGDGIEVKTGSYNNWIVENEIYECSSSCLTVGGAYGNGINMIERNILYNSDDFVLLLHGDAIAQNNLVMNGVGLGGFASRSLQDSNLENVSFTHNTIVSTDTAARLSDWNNKLNMIFANNVAYSRDVYSIRISGGSEGVVFTGNVALGPVYGVDSSGYIAGNGLEDFADITWDASRRNGMPAINSPIRGQGNPAYAVEEDINGVERTGSLDAGAFVYKEVPDTITLSPDPLVLSVNSSGEMTVTVDAAAPSGGWEIDISADGPVSAPSSVIVAEGESSAIFTVTSTAEGTGQISAGYDDVSGSAAVIIESCLGDIDRDGDTDGADLAKFISSFGCH